MTICFYLPCAQDASALLCGYEQLLFLSRKGLLTLKTTTPQSNSSDSYSEADAVFFSRSDSIYEVELARALQKTEKSCSTYLMMICLMCPNIFRALRFLPVREQEKT